MNEFPTQKGSKSIICVLPQDKIGEPDNKSDIKILGRNLQFPLKSRPNLEKSTRVNLQKFSGLINV